MHKLFKSLLTLVWVLDLINIPQLEILDVTIPINTLAWLLIWLFV